MEGTQGPHCDMRAGSMLAVPAGTHKCSVEDRGSDCTYVYARGRWSGPVLRLPAQKVHYVTLGCCAYMLFSE